MNSVKTSSSVGEFTPPHSSLRRLTVGFVSCVILSIAAYIIATSAITATTAMAVVGGLAAVQCAVQLIIFLHLGTEYKPRWRLAIFWLMVTIIGIVVVGSLWIMHNLNYNMMHSPDQLREYIQGQDGL